MAALTAYSTFAVTVGLAVARPRVGFGIRVGPALAGAVGVAVMVLAGVVSGSDVASAAVLLWRPLLAIVAIMVITAAAQQLGALDALAASVLGGAERSAAQLFARVFLLGAGIAAALNNDAAVLLLTPMVVRHVAVRYPGRARLVPPFAFAVLMSAGVAPLVVSNPMNTIVASYAGISFNAYALRMVPVWLSGAATTLLLLFALFRKDLARAGLAVPGDRPLWTAPARHALLLLTTVLLSYPVMSHCDGPLWLVAVCGAAAMLLLVHRHRAAAIPTLLVDGVSWEIIAFLLAVFVLVVGLRNVGIVGHLSRVYASGGIGVVGVTSAIGSAVLNNHPMAIINMMALDLVGARARGSEAVFAALVGGDLGPRLLPTGSLAGLLWLESLRRLDVQISIRRFVAVGLLLTVPTLAVSLAVLKAL